MMPRHIDAAHYATPLIFLLLDYFHADDY